MNSSHSSAGARTGTLAKVTSTGLAYVAEDGSDDIHVFTFDKVDVYAGERAAEIGLVPGAPVDFWVSPDGLVTRVSLTRENSDQQKALAHVGASH